MKIMPLKYLDKVTLVRQYNNGQGMKLRQLASQHTVSKRPCLNTIHMFKLDKKVIKHISKCWRLIITSDLQITQLSRGRGED